MHDVKALVASNAILTDMDKRYSSAVVCPLVQGFALMPITDSLASEMAAVGKEYSESSAPLVSNMAPGVATLAAELSAAGLVAYISTDFFGGAGGQDTIIWKNGRTIFALSDGPANKFEWPNSPVSRTLRKLGVAADAGKDEFDTVGLGRHRTTERWAAAFADSSEQKVHVMKVSKPTSEKPNIRPLHEIIWRLLSKGRW